MKTSIRLLIAILSIGSATLAAAETGNKQELAEIRSKIQQVDADVRKLATQKNAQLERLKQLEKQYGELVNNLNSIKADINRQNRSLDSVRNKIANTQENIKNHRRGLAGLIRSAHAIGDREGLKVVLNQKDPSLSGRILIYHDYISKARLQKLQAIENDLQSLHQLEAQKDTEAQLLQITLDKKQQETDALYTLKKQRENLLAQIDNAYSSRKELLENLLHDEKKLQTLVASLQKSDDNEREAIPTAESGRDHNQQALQANHSSSGNQEKIVTAPLAGKAFSAQQGQLPWPVQGKIIAKFGSRRFETSWDGTVIGAREGASIRAIAAGRVVYADWLRGYGLMIIVDHGKGYMSLYAFNQSLHKSVGEPVTAGETLASVGRSGGRSEPALYFGIRKKGKPVDPELWCGK